MRQRTAEPAIASRRRSPLEFVALVFALSIPFWLIGTIANVQLLPGLPVSSLMAVCPLIAALILVYRERNTAGACALPKRAFDCGRIVAKLWYLPIVLPIVLLIPGVMVLSYVLMRTMGSPIPALQFSALALLIFLSRSSLPRWAKNWAGQHTPLAPCRIGRMRFWPACSSDWCGRRGMLCRLCRPHDRHRGLPGNVWAWWPRACLSSGYTTTRARAYSPQPCSTPSATSVFSCFRFTAHFMTRRSPGRS